MPARHGRELRRTIDGHTIVFDEETSRRMGGVRRKDTSPELSVRRVLHAMGHRYRVHNRDLPGSPDVANRSKKWAIFVHGCYWHRHPGCERTTTPKRNREFWEAKFDRNVSRDAEVISRLEQLGYDVCVIWECETLDAKELRRRVRRLLGLPKQG